MTIDETIKAEETEILELKSCFISVNENTPKYMQLAFRKAIKNQMEYHQQLVEWLRELKIYREAFYRIGEKLSEKGYTEDDLKKLYEEVNADERR